MLGCYIQWLTASVKDMLARPLVWTQVDAVAASLIAHTTISGDDLLATCANAATPYMKELLNEYAQPPHPGLGIQEAIEAMPMDGGGLCCPD